MSQQKADETRLKNSYRPFYLGSQFIVTPPNTNIEDSLRLKIVMARGAFGSGEHETTASCIEMLEQINPKGGKLLDFGSGTGILSIAAIKLGATAAWCLDIDEAAVKTARNNCKLNNITTEVQHFQGPLSLLPEDQFNLLLANIYGDILLAEAENLVLKMKPGAYGILSGILWEDNFSVRNKFTELNCSIIKNQLLKDYSSILLKKN